MEFAVGDRVQSRDDYRATVMYVGSVAGATPEDGWVGIEVIMPAHVHVFHPPSPAYLANHLGGFM